MVAAAAAAYHIPVDVQVVHNLVVLGDLLLAGHTLVVLGDLLLAVHNLVVLEDLLLTVHNLVVLGDLLLTVHTLEVEVGSRTVHTLVAGAGN